MPSIHSFAVHIVEHAALAAVEDVQPLPLGQFDPVGRCESRRAQALPSQSDRHMLRHGRR